jgi:hypothetical protein
LIPLFSSLTTSFCPACLSLVFSQIFLEKNISTQFVLPFDRLSRWQEHCVGYERQYEIKDSEICNAVLEHLKASEYPPDLLDSLSDRSVQRMKSSSSVRQLLHSRVDESSTSDELTLLFADHVDHAMLLYPKIKKLFFPSNPHLDLNLLRRERTLNSSTQTSYLPSFVRDTQRILIYQSLGTVSGGTIALELLHKRLVLLGFQSVLCDSKRSDERCLSPTGQLTFAVHRSIAPLHWSLFSS